MIIPNSELRNLQLSKERSKEEQLSKAKARKEKMLVMEKVTHIPEIYLEFSFLWFCRWFLLSLLDILHCLVPPSRFLSSSSLLFSVSRFSLMRCFARFQELRDRAPELTPEEEEDLRRKKATLESAQNSIEEQLDDVKHMNQMMLYAKCVTIRDKQIIEKVLDLTFS